MANFGEEHCRLCLSTVSDEHFKEVKDIMKMKSIFDVLLLKLDLENSSRNIMCNDCSRKVMEAFRFKSMCIYTHNTIIPYVDDEMMCSIDLKEIYTKEKRNEHLIPTSEDYKVCRLCMQLVKDKFIPAHEMAVDMIETYIPEINLTVVQDPVICKQCFDSFGSHSNFIKNCLEVNEKCKTSLHKEIVDKSIWIPTVDSYIKTEEVDIKSESEQEDECLETDSTVVKSVYKVISNYRYIKPEDEGEENETAVVTDNVSAENLNQCNPSQGNSKYSETDNTNILLRRHLISHKDTHDVRIFQCDTCDFSCKQKHFLKKHLLKHKKLSGKERFRCDTCDYKTKYKNHLKGHQLSHKDISETEVFECNTCDFKTKYKKSLKMHQLIHKDISEMELFECDTCDYKTKYKNRLKHHQLTHKSISEIELFECGTCNYKTMRKGDLKKHQVTHKDISEIKVFECVKCDYKTKRKNSLKRHQLTHKKIFETEVFECDM